MKKIIIFLIFLIFFTFIYAKYLNPEGFIIKEYTLINKTIPNSFNGFKIAHFSDTLLKNDYEIERINNVKDSLNELNLDIVIFTGDLIFKNNNLNDDDLNKLTKYLQEINVNIKKYAIIGDNDKKNIDQYKIIMEKANFTILDNNYDYVFYQDLNPLKIIAVDNNDVVNSLLINEENLNPFYTICLTHYADNVDFLKDYNFNAIFAGHSLGGQIRVPFIGGINKKAHADKYLDSYYNLNNIEIFINNGIGTEITSYRTFNKPTINLYRFQSDYS